MDHLLRFVGTFAGFMLGFAAGIAALLYITKGLKLKVVLGDRAMRLWLGLFGWFFAAVGAYIGWVLLAPAS